MYSLKDILYISFEMWGGVFCILAVLSIRLSRESETVKGIRLTRILGFNALMAASVIVQNIMESGGLNANAMTLRICSLVNIVMAFLVYHQMAGMIDEDLTQLHESGAPMDFIYDRKWYLTAGFLTEGGILLAVVNLLTAAFSGYTDSLQWVRSPGYPVLMLYGFLCILILVVELMAEMKKISLDILTGELLFCFIPIVGIVVEVSLEVRHIVGVCITMGSLVLFLVYQVDKGQQSVRDKLVIEQQRRKLSEMNTQLMLSQVQPHFLYNSLGAIQYLCRKDPDAAYEATGHFSDYLRNSLGAAENDKTISFAKEMKHVKNYLWLEQLRYGEDLKVEYSIEDEGFDIPALTVQALAENAVRHGLMLKHMGGLLTIASRRADGYHEIVIEDDGQGFEPAKIAENGLGGIGKIRERLSAMSGGSMTIASAPEQGTRVTIRIPFSGFDEGR